MNRVAWTAFLVGLVLFGVGLPSTLVGSVEVASKVVVSVTPEPREVSPGESVVINVVVKAIEPVNSSVLVILVNGENVSSISLPAMQPGSQVAYSVNYTVPKPGYYVVKAEVREAIYNG